MIRGYIVYILMFVALGAGLWAVIGVGGSLQAPLEIAGTWNVRWDTPSPTGGGHHGKMKIDQSGRYCTFHFDDARTIHMKIVDGTALGRGGSQSPLTRLVGGGFDMVLDSAAVADAMTVELTGSGQHRGLAERVNQPAERASGPSPTLVAPVADARR